MYLDTLSHQDAIDKVKLKKDDEDAAMMAEMDELVEAFCPVFSYMPAVFVHSGRRAPTCR